MRDYAYYVFGGGEYKSHEKLADTKCTIRVMVILYNQNVKSVMVKWTKLNRSWPFIGVGCQLSWGR